MPHIPNNLVLWCVEYIVQCNGELSHTQGAAQVTTSATDGVDHVCSQLLAQLPQLCCVEVFQVHGVVDSVEQWGGGLATPVVDLIDRNLVKKVVILMGLVMGDGGDNGALQGTDGVLGCTLWATDCAVWKSVRVGNSM